ncbi:hypothetical protein LTR84_001222 [Exophiala bonariae]|uniref:BRCT domain-containing protein n=1 Tax=Exophiala bonariae TaxID=1690606 RepID=A0AAV9NST8_9EURO|nr:hypothetical protein LTR84_001222 [Exophiala bonariae]
MPTNKPNIPPAPQPTRVFFDPFNSSSTGHQRAENTLSGSTSWRDSRTYKLSHQLRDRSGRGGDAHLSDLVGAGSVNYRKDGRKGNGDWEKGAPGLRESGWQDIRGLMAGSRKRCAESKDEDMGQSKKLKQDSEGNKPSKDSTTNTITATEEKISPESCPDQLVTTTKQPPQIFRGLTMYLNGSTAPLVSDHKIKQLFVQHGGNSSFALGRKTVTHVIIGSTCGGGLAATKINKEINTVRGKGIKYVTAQWVLSSIEQGIRQPEARYVPGNLNTKIAGNGQRSVRMVFTPTTK